MDGEKIAVTLPDISTGWIGAKGIFTGINLILGLLQTDAFTIVYKFLQTPLLNLGDT